MSENGNGNAKPKQQGTDGAGVVLFNCTKKESYTPASGYKQFARRLRASYRPVANKDEISAEKLEGVSIVVLGAPREKFTVAEFDTLKKFVLGGGSLLVCMGEGGEAKHGTNINYLLEEFGISINSDCVVRTVHYKYLHPKEVLITDGVLNREINNIVSKGAKPSNENIDEFNTSNGRQVDLAAQHGMKDDGLHFVLPYGATLTVQKPAVSILSSGKIAYPMHRPVGAVWEKAGAGRIAVLGSGLLFEDSWLDKEDNVKLMEFIIKWLTPTTNIQLYDLDAEEPDVNEYQHLPDTEALAERLRCCLQEGDELPRDFTTLFDDAMFKFDTNLVPEAVELYGKLTVKKAPLTLIAPQFETPLPPLQPAVFPPALREPPPPALDLFDLDECFASEKLRLAQLTNKCTEGSAEDLEYYISEGASILGVTMDGKTTEDGIPVAPSPKALLAKIFASIVKFKMSSHLDEVNRATNNFVDSMGTSMNVEMMNS
mmetsp:Transcript_31847/g.38538  ORF Transcript_31847/g.38538 Transcript_31847/m.38538 type:complete len:486 (+) Transcript_31847:279-1736(+)|eukprot:CAMPEP_0197845116 /NCGR_PEP_ID=MMETSP1438-20131217/2060_1 /TAXON_ID=1461541 /ORGANISM="Pterosperma sp., Strain CCMP1384" /LENGTH=485 /DNA_ID=CAMNT_0043456239 /DNA_START=279 /DNA_END=1736 /DNA_ORIENTATION=-